MPHALAPNEVYLTSFANIYPNSATMQDSTAGINAAIEAARAAKQTIIVPKNTTYYITDTIKCRDPYDATSPNNHYGHNSVKLIGEMGGTRPKFVIHPTAGTWDATVYSSRGKPMVHFWRNAAATYPPLTEANKTVHYFATFGNIDLDTNGRPGAWGLAFQGHQHCEIFDTIITATGSLGGIAGGAQTGSPNRNITIIGGATQWLTRGLFTDESAVGLVISHLTLINNEGVGIDLRGSQRASTTVFGLIVSCSSGTPIKTAAAGSAVAEMQTGNISIIDGHVTFTGTAGTAIDNANNRSISLRQVYFENCAQIVNSALAGGDLAGTSGAIHFIDRWHWGNSAQAAGAIVSMIESGGNVTKASMTAQASGSNGVVGSVPDTVNRWYVETPNWWADDVVWLTDSFQGQPGIAPQYPDDVMVDNRAAIQARMDACAAAGRPLFIPGGVGHATDVKSAGGYGIGGTLNLPANLKLIFAVGGQSWFQSTDAWRTAQTTAATVSRMLDTPADVDATYQMWWPVFECGYLQNQYIEAYRSRGGQAVVVNNHKIDRVGSRHCSTPKTMVRIEGSTAGGRWWSCTDHARSANVSNVNTYNASYRHILVSGTREPLALIGFVVETRPTGTTPTIASPAGPLAVFDDCQNVIIGGYKQEEDGMTTGLTRVLNCQNFLLSIAHGWLGDDKLMMVEGTTQIEMDQICHQGGLSSVPIVDLVGYVGTIQEANRTEYLGYLRIGSAVNMSVFPTDWLPTPVAPAVIRPVAATVTAVHVVMWAESSSASAALRAVEIMSGGVNIATVSGNVSHDGLTNAAYLVDGNGSTDATFTDIGRFSYDMSGAPASVESVVLKSSNTLAPPIRAEVWIEVSGITQKLKIADADLTQIAPNAPVTIDVLSQILWLPWHVAAAAKAAAA